MPQALEMEKTVLGALMIDKNAYLEVGDMLRPESFYEPRNQLVYEAIQQLSREDCPVDMLTVTDKLGKMGKLDEAGGPVYVADLSSSVASFQRQRVKQSYQLSCQCSGRKISVAPDDSVCQHDRKEVFR